MKTTLAIRRLLFAAALTSLPLLLWAQSLGYRAALFDGDAITTSRPLVDVADILQSRYEKAIASTRSAGRRASA